MHVAQVFLEVVLARERFGVAAAPGVGASETLARVVLVHVAFEVEVAHRHVAAARVAAVVFGHAAVGGLYGGGRGRGGGVA